MEIKGTKITQYPVTQEQLKQIRLEEKQRRKESRRFFIRELAENGGAVAVVMGTLFSALISARMLLTGGYHDKKVEVKASTPLSEVTTTVPNIDLFDKDNDGVISKEEVDRFVWEVIDKDKDGKLSIDEILELRKIVMALARITYGHHVLYKNLDETYWNFKSQYGEITTQEISRIKEEVLGSRNRPPVVRGYDAHELDPKEWSLALAGVRIAVPGADLFDYEGNPYEVLTGAEIKDFVDIVIDKDHDGKISGDELVVFEDIMDALDEERKDSSVFLANLDKTHKNFREYHTALLSQHIREKQKE